MCGEKTKVLEKRKREDRFYRRRRCPNQHIFSTSESFLLPNVEEILHTGRRGGASVKPATSSQSPVQSVDHIFSVWKRSVELEPEPS